MSGSGSGSEREYELDELLGEDAAIFTTAPTQRSQAWYDRLRRRASRWLASSSPYRTPHAPRRRRSWRARLVKYLTQLSGAIVVAIIACALFFPSYHSPPQRYRELRDRVLLKGGSANVDDEKIFIAASLYDHEGELISGAWGQAVLGLVDILGPGNVFLSIYEDNPDAKAREALESFTLRVKCESSIVTELLVLSQFPHVTAADGRQVLKRIAFLADVRNRALRPLEDESSSAFTTRFDKVLYLNDVIFDPIDAANLILSTNVNVASGKTDYRAACAVDFINPIKFYDTFATRDLEGYDMGVPFFPWFTNAGQAASRKDVLDQKDAVRVKSCWGGMVAFEARWFQAHLYPSVDGHDRRSPGFFASPISPSSSLDPRTDLARRSNTSSLRFRSETDVYWDASECCLIHADLMAMDSSTTADVTGIYMNPYIRVAYSQSTHSWLAFTRRFERLYTPIHRIINWVGKRPSLNPRQFHEPGTEIVDRVWISHSEEAEALQAGAAVDRDAAHGRFESVHRTALPGGFCGFRRLLYINEHPSSGEARWGTELPPDRV